MLDRREAAFFFTRPDGSLARRPSQPNRSAAMSAAAPAKRDAGPLTVCALLVVFAPVGLVLLWNSRRYSTEARLALTLVSSYGAILQAWMLFTLVHG